MRLSRTMRVQSVLVVSVFLGVCSVFVSGLPQWVWNPDAETVPSSGSGNRFVFGDRIAEKETPKIKIDDTQARLFLPSIVNAITGGGRPGNSRPRPTTTRRPSSSGGDGSDSSSSSFPPPSNNGGGGGGGGGSSGGQGEGGNGGGSCNTGACIGGSVASQAIDQGINAGTTVIGDNSVFSNILSSIFGGGGATTLPAGIGGGSGSGSSGGEAQCTCEDRSRGCFLPAREVGACDSGTRIRCCTSTRGGRVGFPDDDFSSSSSTNSVKTVTRSQIRRALLKNIISGSGSIVDDTLDLILHPFLNKEDQVRVATRVLGE